MRTTLLSAVILMAFAQQGCHMMPMMHRMHKMGGKQDEKVLCGCGCEKLVSKCNCKKENNRCAS